MAIHLDFSIRHTKLRKNAFSYIHERHEFNFRLFAQVNLCGGGITTRAAEDVGSIVVQAARDRRARTTNSGTGCCEFSSNVVKHKTVVRIEHTQATVQRQGTAEQRGHGSAPKHR